MENQTHNIEDEIGIEPRDASEPFVGTRSLRLDSTTIGDFWQWAYSNIVDNTNRGVLAEFIVATVLESPESVRTMWTSYDLDTSIGVKVEVKSAAYLQSWSQKEVSRPLFNIGKTFGWDPQTGEYTKERQRHSDVYVFCLLAFKGDKHHLNPLDLRQWEFYVVETSKIEAEFGDRKQASLPQIQRLSSAYAVDQLPRVVADLGQHILDNTPE